MATLLSTLTCPYCGGRHTHRMPLDACVFFHECGGCGRLLRPLAGDCCVFCSYGTVPCPPIQEAGAGGCCAPGPATGPTGAV
ncbi:MAG: GDCCVxC domain-containing (seleno)protein [Nitratireductor sp.]